MGEVYIVDRGALKEVARICGEHIQEFGQNVVERARDNCPVDTGNLKRSIQATGTVAGKSLTVQTRTGYGAYVELGTMHMAAQPFMAPAFVQAKQDFEKSGPWT